MCEAVEIEKDKTYVIEIEHPRSEEEIKLVIKRFKESTGANAIVLVGAKISKANDETSI
jgi:hypothetical protein